MGVLSFIWLASWLLGALSVLWMLLLIVARLWRDHAKGGREAAYQAVVDAYLKLMNDDLSGFDDLAPHRHRGKVLAEALLELLDLVGGASRERLIEALDAYGMAQILRARAKRGAVAARLAAIEALASFPGPETEAVVREAGRRAGGQIRLTAAKALAAMGVEVDLALLIEDMRRRKEAWSGPLGDLLKVIAERQPEACLAQLQRRELPAELRAMIAEALGWSGDYKVLPVLCEAAVKDSPAVRAASLRALGRLMHPLVEPILAHAVRDEDWQVRAAAVTAAGSTGLIKLAPHLAEALTDPVWWVRFQAAEALARLRPDGVQILRKIARAGPDAARRVASLTLAERGLVEEPLAQEAAR